MLLPKIAQSYLDAYNRRDVQSLVDCVAENVIFENVSNSGQSLKVEGREEFAELARKAADMFLDRKQVVRTAVVDGDTIALEIDWSGIPSVDVGPMKAGVGMSVRGASFITIADNKIVRIVDIS